MDWQSFAAKLWSFYVVSTFGLLRRSEMDTNYTETLNALGRHQINTLGMSTRLIILVGFPAML